MARKNSSYAKALTLIANGKVHPILTASNTYFVHSQTQAGGYIVNGTCGCKGFVNRKRCAHKLAADLYGAMQENGELFANALMSVHPVGKNTTTLPTEPVSQPAYQPTRPAYASRYDANNYSEADMNADIEMLCG